MKTDINDLIVLSGVLFVGVGVFLIYPPAAAILIGVLLVALGFVNAGKKPPEGGDQK